MKITTTNIPEFSVHPPQPQKKSSPFGRPIEGDFGDDLEKNLRNKSKAKNDELTEKSNSKSKKYGDSRLVQFQAEGQANKETKKNFDIEESSSRIDFIDSRKDQNLTDKRDKSKSKEEVPKKQRNFEEKQTRLKHFKEDSLLSIVLKCLLFELGDLVTNIMTLNSFYQTQQFWYFGTLLTLMTVPKIINFYRLCIINFDLKGFLRFFLALMNTFIPIGDHLVLSYLNNRGSTESDDDDPVSPWIDRSKIFLMLLESIPSAWISCHAMFFSSKPQELIVYISFFVSVCAYCNSCYKSFKSETWIPILKKIGFHLMEAFSLPILWAVFSYTTTPIGAWLYPIVLAFPLNIFAIALTVFVKPNRILKDNFLIQVFGPILPSVFGNFFYYADSDPFFYFDGKRSFIVKAIGLIFMVIWISIILGIKVETQIFLFKSDINEVMLIMALVCGFLNSIWSAIIFFSKDIVQENVKNQD